MRSSIQRRIKPNRGVAMLLVIVSLMAATIMTTSYVSSRDNSAAIGENSAATTAARWAADSGIEIAEAILQTEADWRDCAQTNFGALVRNYPVGNGSLDVLVTEFGTGAMVGPNTEHIQVMSVGRVNGVEQSVTANAYVPLNAGTTVDLDLSEFAIFVTESLSMNSDALIGRWPSALLSELGRRILIGTSATGANSILLANSAAAIDTTVYHGPGASGSLISNADSPELLTTSLLDQIPMPAPPPHGESVPSALMPDLVMNGGVATIVASARYNSAELKNNAVRTLRGNITLVTDGDLLINSGAKLVIDGQVKIVVFGNTVIDQGAIELKGTSRVRMYVRGGTGDTAFTLRNGYIGELRAGTTIDTTGNAAYIDPQRATLFSDAPVGSSYNWLIDQQSVIKGSIYAPHAATVTMNDSATVYGRIATKSVSMSDSAAVYYDPALDIRAGYSNPESPIFDEDSRILEEFKTLTSLDPALLQAVADTTRTIIKADTGTKSILTAVTLLPDDEEEVPPTDPTPRPIRIEMSMVSFGTNVNSWEE